MRRLTVLFTLLVLATAPLGAKPKANIRVKISTFYGKRRPSGDLGSTLGNDSTFGVIYYLNVTVLSDDAQAVAKNGGDWCIKGDLPLNPGAEYHGILDGNILSLEIPEKNGKSIKRSFLVFDYKWRTLSEL